MCAYTAVPAVCALIQRWYSKYPHFIGSLIDPCFIGGDGVIFLYIQIWSVYRVLYLLFTGNQGSTHCVGSVAIAFLAPQSLLL